MSLRVVLYAEGGNETAGEIGLPPAPGTPLLESNLGSGHLLVRRCLQLTRNIPAPAVRFEGPLRDRRGNIARGTALLHRETLRQLVTWPLAHKRPELVVILVDGDEDQGRKARLEEYLSDVMVPRAIAVAVQEFEAWLIADHGAACRAFGAALTAPRDPERMARREAKELLRSWMDHRPESSERAMRMTLANVCDLEVVRRRCSAFDEFLRALAPRG
jgi:Domain of unknown function (DUF4276)